MNGSNEADAGRKGDEGKNSTTNTDHRTDLNRRAGGGGGGSKGKSCKGYLYYSTTLKSNGSNPRCIGIPRTLPQVPNYIVGQSEVEASKEGRSLADFYYACAGYSVFLNKDDSSTDKRPLAKTELPVCMGLELLVDRKVSNADTASTPAHVLHHKEDGHELPQRRTQKPAQSAGDDFLSRFSRNASLVASGVARNMRRVGNQIKETVDDILYPYRRRPK